MEVFGSKTTLFNEVNERFAKFRRQCARVVASALLSASSKWDSGIRDSGGRFVGWLPYQADRFSSTKKHLLRCAQPESHTPGGGLVFLE